MKFICLLIFVLFYSCADATTITYESSNISGNTWQYIYTVNNDSLEATIEEFSIYFELDLYENLTSTSLLTEWDFITFDPDPFLPEDGLYDALALVSGISAGNSQTGFSVLFDYLGTGTPGSQLFEIVDPSTFAVLDSGKTQAITISEPNVLWLFAMGLPFVLCLYSSNYHCSDLPFYT